MKTLKMLSGLLVSTSIWCAVVSITIAVDVFPPEKLYRVGFKDYVPKEAIRPGQIRIAQAGAQEKVQEAIKQGYAIKKDDGTLEPQFNNKTSIISDKDPLPVVVVTTGGTTWLILLDGHHDYMANEKAGGTTVYVEIKDDLRNTPESALWETLKKKGYIYATNLQGKEVPLPEKFNQLENDPYRFFVKMAMWECKTPETALKESKGGTKELQYPLAVKWKDKKFNPYKVIVAGEEFVLNKLFIEFKVADALYKYGPAYGFHQAGDEKRKETFASQVEIARQILNDHPVESFNLIPEKTHYTEINDGNICAYTFSKKKLKKTSARY